jgi:uncharacterized protein (TIGR02265 family)
MTTGSFIQPDFNEPLDVAPLLRVCTEEHRIKGLFFDAAQKSARRLGLLAPMGRYTAFKEYPSAEYVRVVAGWVSAPGLNEPPRKLLRMMGRDAFDAFRSTVVGKVILAAAGDGLADLLGAAGRAYAISISPGTLVPRVEAGRAELELRNIPTFADSFHVGVFEGVLAAYRTPGTVRLRRHSPVNVDLLIEWA